MKKEKIAGFKDLWADNKRLDVVRDAYEVSKKFPKEEKSGLTNQLRRVVTSIVLNVAGGTG